MKNQKKILLIDDEKFVLELNERLLLEAGFKVEIAVNGEEGLKKMKERYYDLIITDIVMPKIDGLSMLEKFKKTGKKQGKVVILANLIEEQIIEKAFSLGVDGYEFTQASYPLEIVGKVNGYLTGEISKDNSRKNALAFQREFLKKSKVKERR